jgi:hypothetical protein
MSGYSASAGRLILARLLPELTGLSDLYGRRCMNVPNCVLHCVTVSTIILQSVVYSIVSIIWQLSFPYHCCHFSLTKGGGDSPSCWYESSAQTPTASFIFVRPIAITISEPKVFLLRLSGPRSLWTLKQPHHLLTAHSCAYQLTEPSGRM